MKLDENLEERKKLEFVIQNRFGSALLMMNETVRHTEIRDLRTEERKKETEYIFQKMIQESKQKIKSEDIDIKEEICVT